MTSNTNNNIFDQWSRLKEEIYMYQKDNGIEYLDYKKRIAYDFESEKEKFEHEFYYLPCNEKVADERIQIFHMFYETDVWGVRHERLDGEQFELSLVEIESNTEIDRAKYILDKLREKYNYIEKNIHRALIGPKRHFQLPEDQEEVVVLVNLQSLYNRILSSSESQLEIFEYITLNKTISDIYIKILNNHIQDRIKILNPRLRRYRKQVKSQFKIEDVEMSKQVPLIKLNYNSDQQKEVHDLR